MLRRNRVTVQKWLHKYRTGRLNILLEPKKNLGGRPSLIPPNVIEKLEEELQNPESFQSYVGIQLCLTTCFDIELSYKTVHQLVRYKLKSKLSEITFDF
ncbi:MAG: helix-turn-helix domain-containing protein [Okeania sp. SIO2F4]|uniref:helix-turn-helix domain-containing protein n=1 Tax=Okeania sp. SIO2F4 TaxID=2607790 RepID=UPI00142A7048|nr:helix-turn-helix domain-containing protein [Okeania sp. SIO2F4]NES06466.1 helix-turn-helix domain-containing protein [Okeania sp. SIO2F4]